MTNSKLILKDATNYCLSYLLAQPVDLDVMVVVYLLMEYAGLFLIFQWSRNFWYGFLTPMNMVVKKFQNAFC